MRTITCLLTFPAVALAACNEPLPPSDASVPSFQPSSAFTLVSTIAFVSTRDNPTENPLLAAEIYLMDGDVIGVNGGNPRRVTNNSDGDGFPALSPDGKKIVFDSNRLRTEGEPLNISNLFVMNTDGTEDTLLTAGSSATWSPDSKLIAFHASASGTGEPIKPDPGAATLDSDIFVANLDDLPRGIPGRKNITNSPDWIDDDPDWSPDGKEILFTRHLVSDDHINSTTAEIYSMNADGTNPEPLTNNAEEERAPAWSPDGSRIVFMCRKGEPAQLGGLPTFEICVMNADKSGEMRLTTNKVSDLTPTWSLDGQQIMFHRPVGGRYQLFVIKSTLNEDGSQATPTQVTNTLGINGFANWGELRVRAEGQPLSAARVFRELQPGLGARRELARGLPRLAVLGTR